MKTRTKIAALSVAAVSMLGLTACGPGISNADMASENLSVAAENFEIDRLIVGINTFDNSVLFSVEGKCSLERGETLVVTCKHGPDDIRKHYMGASDNVTWISTQLEGADVSEFHTKIILKPQSILPDYDLSTSTEG